MSKISFKGDLKEGIKIIIDPNLNWDEIRNLIVDEIKSKEGFLKGSSIYVDFQGKDIKDEDWQEFRKEIYEKYGIMLSKELYRLRISNSNNAKIVLGPIRSGKSLNVKDNLLVIGDVNSGSEIICNKNVFVLGKVRGSIWAGYENNDKATIFALELEPEKIQIARYILDLSKIKKEKTGVGYWVYVENGEVKLNRYSGGKKNG
ncbi:MULTISPECIES: septum site-determining protein MinC [Dictyoglomus]|mgnify:CR=1 FL=1|uniref:Probable septum site-determining protein MinC n=2 Tax=Dictyoglomus turgidum TaxID=513050 RepID=MINC_DICTD|nr:MULTISPECIES: septum site-determining protein MinC [Dictyoglomus]B8E0T7.1 RecName: Full=Probable septum site-determining protein MinC [Dictyoglomus turgidum DSM 6724]ACK42674.1 Septum formation inhibitor MinC [Dictyoglomus turgidum DSM 6724]PNV78800.1 MAG: septum site-determining protein MinC [Dictyoglomus turgidum]HBU30733.1 septum site-determining protein MinC [Dictyoglomus sp.]